MPTILFQDRFVPLIASGVKRHTIRGQRKRPIKPGVPLSLRHWDGLPYRSPQVLIRNVACLSVKPIRIDEDGIEIAGLSMRPADQQRLAISDGFDSLASMLNWHREAHGLPFDGVLIEWTVS